jgi:hypothetical protein
METKQDVKSTKAKVVQVSTVPVRVKRETKKRLLAELAKVNKKTYGRKVRMDALILRALDSLKDSDISALQESSLSNSDRLEMAYREHAKISGSLTKDEFLGRLLSGKVSSETPVLREKIERNPAQ